MAITFITIPESPNIAGNTTEYVVSSTNIAQPNFKYIFDVRNFDGNLIATVKRTPAPNGRGYFDLSTFAYNELENDGDNLQSQTAPAYSMQNGFDGFQVYVGEEYGIPPAEFVSLAQSPMLFSFKGELDYIDFVNYDPTNYQVSAGATPENLFLTYMPREVRIGIEQKQWITYYRTEAVADSILIITYDVQGNEIDQMTVNLATSGLPTPLGVRVGVGVDQLNSYTPVSGSQPIITDDVYKYIVYVINESTDAILTEGVTFVIDRKCYKESRTFYFKNSFGAYESFTFNGIKSQEITYDREIFGRPRALGESEQPYRRFRRNIDIEQRKTFTLTSNYITPEESEWIKDLFGSYDAFVVENGQQIAINILNNYRPQTRNNSRLINAEIIYEYTY